MKITLAVAAVAVLAAGCGSPHLVVPVPPGTPAAHQISHDRDGATSATLDIVNGATSIDVAMSSIGSKLFTAATPVGSAQLPQAAVSDGHVQLSLPTIGSGDSGAVTVVLNPAVVWTVNIDGGATDDVVDARLGKLTGVTIAAGATSIDLTLPAASGTVTVHETGGASRVAVHVVGILPAQVRFSSGAASAVIDGVAHSGIAGGTAFTPPGWATASNRYDIDMDAGVSSFTLDRSA
jgi:hypothetical protein